MEDEVLRYNSYDVPLIVDKIVFSHSMSNNILASAIKYGYCDFDSTSSWYDVSGPLHGSQASNFLENICQINDSVLQWVVDDFGLCNDHNETASNWELRPSYPGLVGLSDIMTKRIKGALCGNSAFGMLTEYSVPLWTLAELVQYNETNDGLVPLSSCAITGEFSSSPLDPFYLGAFNHADTTCRNGGDPCQWYAHRT